MRSDFPSWLPKLPSDWSWLRFTQVINHIVDNRGRTAPTSPNGIPLIATNCIVHDGLYPTLDTIRYVSLNTYQSWFRGHPKPGDVIIVNKGTPGRTCLVPDLVNFCFAQDMVSFNVKAEISTNDYVFSFLRSQLAQEQIRNNSVGTSIPHLKKGDFDKIFIPIPPYHEAKKIGELYRKIGDLIENTRKMNEILEEMAQAIFKSWFIDFDGVPEEDLVESELGLIPRGWEVVSFKDVVTIHNNKRIPLSSAERSTRKGYYPYHGAASIMDYIDDYLFDGVYVLMGEDGSVVTSEGKPVLQYVWGKFWVNNHAHTLTSSTHLPTEFIYLFLSNTLVSPYVTGAVQPKINQTNLSKIPLVLPPKESSEVFSITVKGLFEQYRNNTEQIQTLSELRDTLLPKLISGELRIPEAEKIVEDIL